MRTVRWPSRPAAALPRLLPGALLACLSLSALAQTFPPTPPAPPPSQAPATPRTPSADGPPLTLGQAQALAAARSVLLSAAQREVDAQQGALQQAGARLNPALTASVEDTRPATRTTTATFDLPIEMGGKRAARLAVAGRAQALAQAELDQARAQLRADVARAFFAVLVAQERAALSQRSAALAARGGDAVQRRVAAGKLSPVDATRARVDQANAQLEAVEADAELQNARQALALLWGDGGALPLAVQGDVEAPLAAPLLADLVPLLDDAPALRSSRLEAERRRALLALERSKATPDLTLSVGAKRDNDLGRTQAIVGISVPLPFFDRNQGAIAEAGQRAAKADDEVQLARLQLLGALQQAVHQLRTAQASAGTLKTTVLPAAQQAYDAATLGFEAGKFGFLDVIDAQRALLQARSRHLAALAASHQAVAAIDRVLGR